MQCEPHYVRCVKTNDEKRPLYCDDERVAHQCKYLGLPENVRVRRAGFAYRTEYHRFLERFKTLSRATYPLEWTATDQSPSRQGRAKLAAFSAWRTAARRNLGDTSCL